MSDSGLPAESDLPHGLESHAYTLTVRQQPERAKVYVGTQIKEKDRKPIDPPPIVQLQITDPADPAQNYLQSPYYFICCSLVDAETNETPQIGAGSPDDDESLSGESPLQGTLVSSLHRLKDTNNTDGGFFVFPDITVRTEGKYRLRFSLFELVKQPVQHVIYIKSVLTNTFEVYSHRFFPGMLESTFLSRSFSDQGVRLRVRKEPRILGKRPAQSTDLPTHPTGEGSSRSGSIQEGSGVHSPTDQIGPFSSAYGESSPGFHPGSGAQYRGYPGVHQRETHVGRGSFYGQETETSLNYPQGFPPRQEQYQNMNPLQAGGSDAMSWNQSFQQQRYARQPGPPHYAMQEGGSQNFYGSVPGPGSQGGAQFPPSASLPSSGSSMQQAAQAPYGRGSTNPQYNYMPAQESYQQFQPRNLAPVSGSNAAMTYTTSGAQSGSISGEATSQGGFNPQAGYGHYPGQHQYR